MNPFYLTWMVFFTLYCSSQSEPLEHTSNTDCGHRIRCNSHPQVHEINYIWTIHQFSRYEAFNTSEILSPKLHAPTTYRYEWDVAVVPNYIHKGDETIAVYVYLSSGSVIDEAVANSNVSIINHNEETLFYRSMTKIKHIVAIGGEGGWGDYCKKDDFFRHHLLQNDTLTLLINIQWFSQSCNNVSHERNPSPTPMVHETTTIQLNHSANNFESLLENSKFADVVLTINGSTYPAHKAILAARSPVFAAMLERNNSKNKKIRIHVTRMNEEVLRAMLQYIYTGSCASLRLRKLADKLFVAAAKYGLDGLKKICEQTLCVTLSTKNAVKMLIFAEKHHANELKFKATQFIANRSARKLNTTG
ncbi:speckle-type POZ protein-like [Planococcus citri]|uniref:speckle-type POZ protein-like n=1 Tax=Planococcus citri TaxID=170843 RepID=UPI0031F82A47